MLGAGRTLLTVHLGETEEKQSYMRNAAEILNEQLEAGAGEKITFADQFRSALLPSTDDEEGGGRPGPTEWALHLVSFQWAWCGYVRAGTIFRLWRQATGSGKRFLLDGRIGLRQGILHSLLLHKHPFLPH